MGNAQVGGGPHAESGDAGKETGDARVVGGPRAGAMMGLCLSAEGWDDGARRGGWGQGGR